MKTSELTGAALDWAVAKCENKKARYVRDGEYSHLQVSEKNTSSWTMYQPSVSWAESGPIIEREGIWLRGPHDAAKPDGNVVLHIDFWYAHKNHIGVQNGPTPLIASMRCYVASKLGAEVEIPEELIGE